MESIELKPKKTDQIIWFIFFSLLTLSVSIGFNSSNIKQLFCIVACLLVWIKFLIQMLPNRGVITLNPTSFAYCYLLGIRKYDWTDIDHFYVSSFRGIRRVWFKFKHPSRPNILTECAYPNISPGELADLMNERVRQNEGKSPFIKHYGKTPEPYEEFWRYIGFLILVLGILGAIALYFFGKNK